MSHGCDWFDDCEWIIWILIAIVIIFFVINND